ncbi:Aste57867_7211 [Aphanomyces stellatus]|uniref:Aste57867_7211 protein n=1 Tax=Aphanomyces stellatus TaxID=120398 RepID=A0A485KHM6_9STRA|nr:hypothetical protein As57867_007186 [Aphanomyces stellatus]VFT84137.1 Aste57867_7211 [Aphanomyces stellatus]
MQLWVRRTAQVHHLRRIVERDAATSMQRAWMTWKYAVQVDHLIQHGLLTQLVLRWRVHVAQRQRTRSLLQRCAIVHRRNWLDATLGTWRQQIHEVSATEKANQATQQTQLRRVWHAWQRMATLNRCRTTVLGRVVLSALRRHLVRGVTQWKAWLLSARHMQVVQRMLRQYATAAQSFMRERDRWHAATSRRVVKTWLGHVRKQHRLTTTCAFHRWQMQSRHSGARHLLADAHVRNQRRWLVSQCWFQWRQRQWRIDHAALGLVRSRARRSLLARTLHWWHATLAAQHDHRTCVVQRQLVASLSRLCRRVWLAWRGSCVATKLKATTTRHVFTSWLALAQRTQLRPVRWSHRRQAVALDRAVATSLQWQVWSEWRTLVGGQRTRNQWFERAMPSVTLQRKLWNEYMLEPLIYN